MGLWLPSSLGKAFGNFISVKGIWLIISSVERPQIDTPSCEAAWIDGAALKFYCVAKNRVFEAGPALFVDGIYETWFAGDQESSLLKCFSDCAPTIREQVRKVLGSLSTHYELHYFDGRLSSLVVENNGLKE